MAVQVIEEDPSSFQKYQVRCKDKYCRKLLQYTMADLKKGYISSCGDREAYFGISCPSCAETFTETYLARHAVQVKQ